MLNVLEDGLQQVLNLIRNHVRQHSREIVDAHARGHHLPQRATHTYINIIGEGMIIRNILHQIKQTASKERAS